MNERVGLPFQGATVSVTVDAKPGRHSTLVEVDGADVEIERIDESEEVYLRPLAHAGTATLLVVQTDNAPAGPARSQEMKAPIARLKALAEQLRKLETNSGFRDFAHEHYGAAIARVTKAVSDTGRLSASRSARTSDAEKRAFDDLEEGVELLNSVFASRLAILQQKEGEK